MHALSGVVQMTTETKTPWAHVAFKGDHFGGVIAADLREGGLDVPEKEVKKWKREVAKFCGDFIADGYEVKTVYSRTEYNAFLDGLKT